MKGVLVSLVLIAATLPSSAQTHRDYRCTIERLEAASLQGKNLEFWRKTYAGKEFSVERQTGLMAGALKNSFNTKPQVIDLGSSENSFKVVTTMKKEQGAGAGSNVHVLVVNEFDNSAMKPFVFLDTDQVFFGTCVHF